MTRGRGFHVLGFTPKWIYHYVDFFHRLTEQNTLCFLVGQCSVTLRKRYQLCWKYRITAQRAQLIGATKCHFQSHGVCWTSFGLRTTSTLVTLEIYSWLYSGYRGICIWLFALVPIPPRPGFLDTLWLHGEPGLSWETKIGKSECGLSRRYHVSTGILQHRLAH